MNVCTCGKVIDRAATTCKSCRYLVVPLDVRFWAKVDKRGPDECWEWQGIRTHGYGIFPWINTRNQAHRVAYELTNGPIPDGLHVCHHCDNPPCVNPAHLFLGTRSDNMQDMAAKGRGRKPLTHCQRGHAFAGNTYVHPKTGTRACRTCKADYAKAHPKRLAA